MPRPMGLPKTGGRKKGVRNKKTRYLSEVLNAKGFSVVDQLIALLDKLNAAKRADVLLALLGFMYPRRATTNTWQELGEEIQEEYELKEEPMEPQQEAVASSAKPTSKPTSATPLSAVATERSPTPSADTPAGSVGNTEGVDPTKTGTQAELTYENQLLENAMDYPTDELMALLAGRYQ